MTRNYFIKNFNIHVSYMKTDHCYESITSKLEELQATKQELCEVFESLNAERERRINLEKESLQRKQIIFQNYIPLHKSIYRKVSLMKTS